MSVSSFFPYSTVCESATQLLAKNVIVNISASVQEAELFILQGL